MENKTKSEYDSPWKEALDIYFPEFMEFFFPRKKAEVRRQKAEGYFSLFKLETNKACISSTLFMAISSHSIFGINSISLQIINWVSNSLAEPKAICKK